MQRESWVYQCGAGLLGFGSALIVGPCVTPPLAAALIYVAQTGNVLRGSSALFALGVGMGIPLLAFGILGAKVLPRSGPWLAHVKTAFGFIFIGLCHLDGILRAADRSGSRLHGERVHCHRLQRSMR